MDEKHKNYVELTEKLIQNTRKKINNVDQKLQNNDYDECDKINHDKMILENRKMILENKIEILELFKENANSGMAHFEYANTNNLIIGEIIDIINKDSGISQGTKEKISKLLHKLKPKKLTLDTGLVKAEW